MMEYPPEPCGRYIPHKGHCAILVVPTRFALGEHAGPCKPKGQERNSSLSIDYRDR